MQCNAMQCQCNTSAKSSAMPVQANGLFANKWTIIELFGRNGDQSDQIDALYF